VILKHLYLKNFRNYSEASISFDEGVNAFYGENGQGKSNFVEALHFLMTGQSFRTSRIKDLISKGESYAYLELDFIKNGITQHLQVYFDHKERKIQHNNSSYIQLRYLLGVVLGFTLTPEDLFLAKGPPDQRRSFLNLYIAQYDPLYVFHLLRYQRALKQRNALFRLRTTLHGIHPWEQEMARSGSYLIIQRKRALKDLEENLCLMKGRWLRETNKVELCYKQSFKGSEESAIVEELAQQRYKDQKIGFTRYGPQRDDFSFILNEQEARFFASEGELRGCIVGLRFAQWKRLKELTGESPLLIIDDIRSSFDDKKIQRLLDFFPGLSQVIFTSTTERWTSSSQKSFTIASGNLRESLVRSC
jgi:DNA replication and repair protein RecF